MEKPITMTSVISDRENPEGIDHALQILARIMVRKYMAEKQRMQPEIRAESGDIAGTAPAGKRLLDVQGLSEYLSLPKATIYTWVSLKRIPERAVIRLGRTLRFDLKEIDTWVEQQKHQG